MATTCSRYYYCTCFLHNHMLTPHHSPQKSQTISVYRWTHRLRHTLTSRSSFWLWGLQLGLHHRSTWFLNCNLTTTISILPSLLDTAVTFFCTGFTQHFYKWQAIPHKLSSLNNNNTGIYLSLNVKRMFILKIPITRSCHCLLKS